MTNVTNPCRACRGTGIVGNDSISLCCPVCDGTRIDPSCSYCRRPREGAGNCPGCGAPLDPGCPIRPALPPPPSPLPEAATWIANNPATVAMAGAFLAAAFTTKGQK